MMGKCIHWLIVGYIIGLAATALNYLRVSIFFNLRLIKNFNMRE
jgi:hypothetical protein